jgi:sulfofructose kinase
LNKSDPSPIAVFVGLAVWDTIALVPEFPEPDGRVVAEAIVEAGGGPAATAAVACVRLGMPAAFVGAVGDDARGARILDALRSEGVDVSSAVVVPGMPSAAAVVVADRSHATRALCPTMPPIWSLTAGSAQASRIASAAILHVDHAGYAPVMSLYDRLGEATPPLSIDAGNPIPGLDYRRAAVFAPTLQRLVAAFGRSDPDVLLRHVAGPEWVVATDGAAGAYVLAGGQSWHVPAYQAVPCISTLGAGDVFHGALVAAWMRGLSPNEAAAYAGIAAGLSCRAIDGRSAIPDHPTVIKALPEQIAAMRHLMEA